jgi:nitroimidazol reductase NimA-like FMN-containing flavoprotein (pyridoxamine 5'-phosphate oxidase superfamily)
MEENAARHTTEPTTAGQPGPAAPRPRTDRTRIRRHADRAVPDRIEEFLATGLIAHVACVEEGEPRVIPFLYHYEAGNLYIHGSVGNATLRMLRDGRPVAVAVSTLVELVASKLAPGHTANYRSVVVYGHGRSVEDLEEKRRVFEAMTSRYWPGRTAPADYSTATDDDLRMVELTAIEIDEASAKLREGGSLHPEDDDPNHPGSAFIRPVR